MAETYYIGKLTGEITKLSQLENDVGFVNHLQINGVELAGNKTLEDLGITTGGNWVNTNSITLYSGGNTTPQTLSLADYLPAGYSLYEVILVTQVVAVAPLDSYTDIQVSTQYGNYSLGACKCTNANMANALVTTVTIPVGADRTINLVGNSNDNGSCTITLRSYRHGTLTSGGSATAYTDLTNKPSINNVTLTGNKSSSDLGLVSDANFLPDGYTINLKADGTGDFETIQDAIDSLNGKVCPGTVSIELAAGTYSISNSVTVDTTKFNISVLSIVGNGIDSTIISKSIVGSLFYITNTRTTVSISALTLQGPGYTTYSSMACIQITNAYAKLQNIKVANSSDNLVTCTQNSRIVLQGTLYFEYSYSRGIYVTDSSILSQQGAVVANVNTMGTFAGIVRSSIISLPNITVNATNVPNIFSKTKNTIDLNGYIISNA